MWKIYTYLFRETQLSEIIFELAPLGSTLNFEPVSISANPLYHSFNIYKFLNHDGTRNEVELKIVSLKQSTLLAVKQTLNILLNFDIL